MKKLFSVLLVFAMLCGLCACGGTSSPAAEKGSPSAIPSESPTAAPSETPTATPSEPPVESSSPEPEPEETATALKIGDSIDNENFLMTFDSMELMDEYNYRTGDYSSTSVYVEDGYKLLAVRGHFENKGTKVISTSSFTFSAVVNDTYEVFSHDYGVQLDFERSNHYEIDPYTDMNYVLYMNVPKKLAEMYESASFTIGFNDDLSTLTTVWDSVDGVQIPETDNVYVLSSGSSAEGEPSEGGETERPDQGASAEGTGASQSGTEAMQTIAIGDTITTDEYEFTLENVELTYELLPSDTSSVYTSYPAEKGKVYVHVAASLKNLMKRDIRIEETFGVKALYSDDYTYSGFVVVDDGNRFDWVDSYVAATPLETAKVHGLVECPSEVDSTDKALSVIIKLSDDVEYKYVIR